MLCLNAVDVVFIVVYEVGSEIFETQEMRVETATSNLVATGLCYRGLAEATQQRTDHQHGATQRRAFVNEVAAVEKIEVDVVGLKRIVVGIVTRHLHTNVAQQLDEVVDIEDVRYIGDAHRVAGEQCGTDHLQRLVLGTLRCDGSLQGVTTLNDKRCHDLPLLFLFTTTIVVGSIESPQVNLGELKA